MNRWTPRALTLAALLTLPAAAPATPPPPADADTQEIVFLAGDRPVWLRLHIDIDGRSMQAHWADFLRKYFDFLDRDGDGFLSQAEIKPALTPGAMTRQLQQVFFFRQPGERVRWTSIDTDQDGKVSFAEFQDYYRTARPRAFLLQPLRTFAAPARSVNEALLKLLDTDKDGKLSRAELEAAPGLLARFDIDDDECVSLAELVPDVLLNRFRRGVVPATGRITARRPSADEPFIPFVRGEVPASLPLQLVNRYDRDGDGRLSRAEIGLDEATFAALDTDKDGKLDDTELKRWFERTPEQTLRVRLGATAAACSVTVEKSVAGRPAARVRRDADHRLSLEVGRQTVQLNLLPPSPGAANGTLGQRQALLALFDRADRGKKGYLDARDVGERAFATQLQVFHEVADRNGDGKLTRDELNAYLDVMAPGANNACMLTTTTREQSWFDLLDADGDGRLSLRELRGAWKRLSATEGDGKGYVTNLEPRQRFELHLFQGQQLHPLVQQGLNNPLGTPVPMPRSARGPVWFRKMDRNGDGDVSPREFLGPPELFKLLDQDGDGLISAEEAEAADPRLVPKPAK